MVRRTYAVHQQDLHTRAFVVTHLEMRIRSRKHVPPFSFRPLLRIMHGHDGDIPSPVGFFHVNFKRSSSGGYTVIDKENRLG